MRAIDTWLTDEADADLAERLLRAIVDRADFLLDFPKGGPSMGDDRRSLRVKGTPYSLLYRVLGDDEIQILRVHHASQNWQRG